METANPNTQTHTVYVVQIDHSKDLSDAKRFGQLRAIFNRPRKPYHTPSMIARARRILDEWRPGDYLLMIGDPTLCAVCMSIAGEVDDVINVLSWDRDTFQYLPQRWDFGAIQQEFDFEDHESLNPSAEY